MSLGQDFFFFLRGTSGECGMQLAFSDYVMMKEYSNKCNEAAARELSKIVSKRWRADESNILVVRFHSLQKCYVNYTLQHMKGAFHTWAKKSQDISGEQLIATIQNT